MPTYHTKPEGDGGDKARYMEIMILYLDLLRIIEAVFRKELGDEFEDILKSCKKRLPVLNREMLEGLELSRDSQTAVLEKLGHNLPIHNKHTENRLMLSSTFNKLIFLLLLQMRERFGELFTENTLYEMVHRVDHSKRGTKHNVIAHYAKENLKDLIHQWRIDPEKH